MRKEGALNFLLGIAVLATLTLVYLKTKLFFLGIVVFLLMVIINSSKKDFIQKDIYKLTYFLGAIAAVAAIKPFKLIIFILGIIVMLSSILILKFKLKKEKKHIKEKSHNFEFKGIPKIFVVIVSLITVIMIILSVIMNNKNILYFSIILAVIVIILSILSRKNHKKVIQDKNIPKKQRKENLIAKMKLYARLTHGKYETDLDKLYKIIQKFKSIKFSEIEKVFNINNEKAEEWAKILEEHNLAQIHYPAFGEPELKWKQ